MVDVRSLQPSSDDAERDRVARDIAGRLFTRGVDVRDDDSNDDVTAIEEAVERFESRVQSAGGDLMVDEPPRGQEESPTRAASGCRCARPTNRRAATSSGWRGRRTSCARSRPARLSAPSPASRGRRRARSRPRGDRTRDPLGVPRDAMDHRRGQRIQEVQPDEIETGVCRHHPRSCIGSPSGSITGMSSHDIPAWKPVHQITFATGSTVPSASTGCPSRTPTVRPTRRTPAASSASALPDERAALLESDGRARRPIGVSTVITRWNTTRKRKGTIGARTPSIANGT